jgi:hypothetical protein
MPNYRILGIAASETSSAKVCQNAVFPNCVLKTRHNLRIRTHAYPPLGNQPSRRQLLRLEPERQSVTAVDGSRAAPVVAAAMGGRTWSPTRRTWSRSSPDRRAPCRRASGCPAVWGGPPNNTLEYRFLYGKPSPAMSRVDPKRTRSGNQREFCNAAHHRGSRMSASPLRRNLKR